jgi:hypothetical protein
MLPVVRARARGCGQVTRLGEEDMRSRGQVKKTYSRSGGQDEEIYFVRSGGHEERICFLEVLISGYDEKLLGIMRLVE